MDVPWRGFSSGRHSHMIYDAFTEYTVNETRRIFGFHGTIARAQTMFGLYDMLKDYLTQVTMLGDKYTQSCDRGYYPAILP